MTHEDSTDPLVVTPSLCASYEAADYEIHGRGASTVLRIGGLTPTVELDDEQRWRRVAVVTAWNPFSAPLPAETNFARQAQLLREVERAGRAWLPALGRDPGGAWAPEPSLAVFDASDDELDDWMLAFGQNAVVVAAAAGSCGLRFHPHERSRVELEGPAAERSAARLWARAWNTGELDLIEGALAEDVITSALVGAPIAGRAAVGEHLRDMRRTRATRLTASVATTAGREPLRPCAVLSEGESTTPATVVLFTLRHGLVARVELCPAERS